jgi:hypothetical protein
MTFDETYITYGLVASMVIMLFWILYIQIRLHRLLLGKNARSLEDTITTASENLKKLNEFQREVVNHFINVEKRLKRSVQAVETLRFNPFKGTGDGGNQSFSTSFVSENGDGVVVSSIYSRDRVSVFSKPLAKFESSFELTEEEKEVIENSKKNLA